MEAGDAVEAGDVVEGGGLVVDIAGSQSAALFTLDIYLLTSEMRAG